MEPDELTFQYDTNNLSRYLKNYNVPTVNSISYASPGVGEDFMKSYTSDLSNSLQSGLKDYTAPAIDEAPWYTNGDFLSGAAGLASSLVQLAALPSQMKLAKTQTKALKQNIATAKEEQARRNKNIAGFNQPMSQLSSFSSAPSPMPAPTYSSFANRSGI